MHNNLQRIVKNARVFLLLLLVVVVIAIVLLVGIIILSHLAANGLAHGVLDVVLGVGDVVDVVLVVLIILVVVHITEGLLVGVP